MMDVMMPNVNGMQALESIKANKATKDIQVIMLLANDDPILLMKAMQLGANRFLGKSTMEPAQVLSIVTGVASAQ